ncbi:hypothetical protein [Phenylobacterium sp.]|jgi:hypothetical protein|uniref:hypothetical protein n=1 Tax=Phenylobacterium sp. TaxID=1871053 RepID=UPI002F94867F
MNRAPLLVCATTCLLAASAGSGAANGVSSRATAEASVTLVDVARVDVVTTLVLPSVTTQSVTGTSGLQSNGATSAGAGTPGSIGSNAVLTIHGQAGEAVSMAVPAEFQVVRTGGTESLTVKTSTNSNYDLGGNGVVVGGPTGDTMSVNVGGTLNFGSGGGELVPGPYEGVVVLLVQYN